MRLGDTNVATMLSEMAADKRWTASTVSLVAVTTRGKAGPFLIRQPSGTLARASDDKADPAQTLDMDSHLYSRPYYCANPCATPHFTCYTRLLSSTPIVVRDGNNVHKAGFHGERWIARSPASAYCLEYLDQHYSTGMSC